MRRLITLPWILGAVAAAPLAAQDGCENLDPSTGYPVSATWVDSGGSEPAYLAEVLGAAVYRWRVPSRRRGAYRGWDRVRRRLLPPEPRWADDWSPDERHIADMPITLFRDGDARAGDVGPESGDGRFDNSLESIVDEPMPGAPEFPAFPPSITGDSVVLRLHFGTVPPDAEVIRFAAQQSPARLVPRTLRIQAPTRGSRSATATFKYDVTATGRVDFTSFEILTSTDRNLSRAIEVGLRQARFDPAISNCRPIAQSMIQTAGN